MSKLREAAHEAMFWMEKARLYLTIRERMHPDGLSLYDSVVEGLRAALAEPKTELRDQHKAFTHWFLTQNPIAPSPEDMAWAAWKAALAEPKTELRDQHKAFTHWYFGLRGINEANFSPEYLAWAAWKAALAQPETEAGVSWGGHSVRGDADSIAEVRRLIDFEQARQGAKPATGDDLRVYDAIAANYNAQPETAEPVAWMWQHDETGRTGFVDAEQLASGWRELNPRLHVVRPLYTHPPRDEWRLASEELAGAKPHAYLLEKLAMVMPLFQEARDALTAITEQQRAVRGISPTLADRMDAAGTYSVDDWRDVQPPR